MPAQLTLRAPSPPRRQRMWDLRWGLTSHCRRLIHCRFHKNIFACSGAPLRRHHPATPPHATTARRPRQHPRSTTLMWQPLTPPSSSPWRLPLKLLGARSAATAAAAAALVEWGHGSAAPKRGLPLCARWTSTRRLSRRQCLGEQGARPSSSTSSRSSRSSHTCSRVCRAYKLHRCAWARARRWVRVWGGRSALCFASCMGQCSMSCTLARAITALHLHGPTPQTLSRQLSWRPTPLRLQPWGFPRPSSWGWVTSSSTRSW